MKRLLEKANYFHIFLFALALRAVYLVQAWRGNEIIGYPVVDADVYVRWARSILQGRFLWAHPSNYTPIYPLYLSFWFHLFGDDTKLIFLIFHVFGALQAVAIGKIAEAVWNRKTGLVAGLIAAAYWPLIVFEASFYAENFALWTLSFGLYFLSRHLVRERNASLLGSGVFIGLSGLARANVLLCAPFLALRLAFGAVRKKETAGDTSTGTRALRAAKPVLVFLLPMLLLAAPILAWNRHLTGAFLLRTQAGLSLYLGNNPDFGGLVVPPGIAWHNLVAKPLQADKTLAAEKEAFWTEETRKIIRTRTTEWLGLQWRKFLMHTGRFEVSQEIDVYRFRESSSVLRLPVWPGFGFVAPLALAGVVLAMRKRERKADVLMIFALVYFLSFFPVQAASRYRLPIVVSLIPLAASFLVWTAEQAATRRWQALLPYGGVLAAACIVIFPDYTDLGSRNVIKHSFFVGARRAEDGDICGALEAYAECAKEYPDDGDALLRMGNIFLETGNIAHARASFLESRRRQPKNPHALLGLARCAMEEKAYDEAPPLIEQALRESPNSMLALQLTQEIHLKQGHWEQAREALLRIRSYMNPPPRTAFDLALVDERLGRYEEAIALYRDVSEDILVDPFDRHRAAFSAGVLLWRHTGDAAAARECWKELYREGVPFFGPLAACLVGAAEEKTVLNSFDEATLKAGHQQIVYALGVAAWIAGDHARAREHFEEIVTERNARTLKPHELTIPEFWALADLQKL